MKNTASKKKTCLGFLLIVFLAYVVCYLLSQTVFHEVYLFEWTAAHYYLCLWVASVTFCFLEMYRAALITAENQKAAGKEYEQEEHNGNKIFFGTEEMIFQGKLPKEDFYPSYAVQLGKML